MHHTRTDGRTHTKVARGASDSDIVIIPEVPCVSLDDLEGTDWGYQQTLWQGQPFTGIAYEERPDGSLISEADYDDGFQRGSREWYPGGQPREDKRFGPYGPDGLAREWYPDGRLRNEALYEHGIALYAKAWDEQGNLTRNDRLSETAPDYARLRERRRAQAAPSEASA